MRFTSFELGSMQLVMIKRYILKKKVDPKVGLQLRKLRTTWVVYRAGVGIQQNLTTVSCFLRLYFTVPPLPLLLGYKSLSYAQAVLSGA